MPITIGSNIASLSGQRRLAESDSALGRVFERLSSGQRINRASDDAAGLAIASGLNAGKRVFTTGIRNLNDGLSLLSIADSTVGELSSIVTRLRELAQQSANGTFSNVQRAALDTEAQELSKEFFRISRASSFNNLNLFDGSLGGGVRFQGGFGIDGSVFSQLGGALGTGGFGSGASILVGDKPSSTAAGDLNGDGILDLVSANAGVNTVSILLGNGDGTFTNHATIAGGDSPSAVTLGDLNGDGILDLIHSNESDDTLAILLGNGDGTFASHSTVATGGGPTSITLGDLNGDGILDAVSTNISSNTLSVFLGIGDGTFSSQGTIATGNAPSSVTLGDLNGDGVLDVVSTNRDDATLTITLGNGDGTFSNQSSVATGLELSAVTLGDLNGDGILDVVSADYGSSSLSILLGNGDGTFTSHGAVATGNGPTSVALGDLNGDGILDAVAANTDDNALSILLGNGDGTFTAQDSLATGINPSAVTLGDLDGDGVLDIINANFTSGSISSFLSVNRDGISPLLSFSLATKADALQAIAPIESKLRQLGEQRGVIGAFQSRLAAAVSTLQSQTENYAAAEGRIRDTQVEQDSAELTRLSILRNAASAVLAQANLQPQISLLLLSN